MNRMRYYSEMNSNLKLVNKLCLEFSNMDYLCPICKQNYTKIDVKNILTEEDVPQKSLGGKRIVLTCKQCNNSCGFNIDNHLLNAIKKRELKQFLPETERKIKIEQDNKILNANLLIDDQRNIKIQVNTKYNNPNIWSEFYGNILLPNSCIEISDIPLKSDEARIDAAILKNAYLMLFAKTGYSFLFDEYYDLIRNKILNPDKMYFPKRLWTIQNLFVNDGIYLTRDNRYRGFFVVYTLKLKCNYKVCVLIPTPNVPYISAIKELENLERGSVINLRPLPILDFFTNIDNIVSLRNWCYGHKIDM